MSGSGNSIHILVIDDDDRVRKMLRRCLEGEGFRVTEATDGASAAAALYSHVDLVTLDLNLSGADGLDVARSIRRTSTVPIIIITGKGDLIDRIVGLELGADDYIAKPFHLREVLARVRSVLRRTTPSPDSAAPSEAGSETVSFDGMSFDPERRELLDRQGVPIRIADGEFELLAVFLRSGGRILSRDRIMDLLRGEDWNPNDRSVDNRVARLRKLIEIDPARPRLLTTVRNVGYRLNLDPKDFTR